MSDGDPNKDSSKAKKPGRFARHSRIVKEIYAEPRSLGGHVRDGFIAVWLAHGAGFYGLGWICTFVVLEVNTFGGELAQSEGVAEFVGGQFIEYVIRVGFLSFVNSILAAIWPVYLLQWLSGYGILVLVGGYLAFERLLRPVVENRFPELRAARQAADARKLDKQEKRQKKKARNQRPNDQ